MFYLRQECTRVAKERIIQSLQQVQTTIERSKVEEMFRESSQQLKGLEVCEDVNAWVYNAISIISLLFFSGQTFHWTDMQNVIFALVGWYNQPFGLIILYALGNWFSLCEQGPLLYWVEKRRLCLNRIKPLSHHNPNFWTIVNFVFSR